MGRKKKIIKEEYEIDQFTGIASLLGKTIPGYKLKNIKRVGTKATVTYQLLEK